MSFRESNLRALKARFPLLVEDLEKAEAPAGVPEPELMASRSLVPTLRCGARLAYSSYRPLQDAERSLPEDDPDADVVLVAGWGLGYAALALANRSPDLPLVVVEPDPRVFRLSLDAYDLGPVWRHPGLVLTVGGSPAEVAALWSMFTFRKTLWAPFRFTLETYPEWMQAFEAAWRTQSAQARVNEDTLRRFSGVWIRNHVRNRNRPGLRPLDSLSGVEKGRSLLIAAAGPSLGASLAFLRRNRKNFVLVGVDTAWNALHRSNLDPDYLVVLDGQYWNSRHVDGPLAPNTRLVVELTSHPRTFSLAPGRTFVGASNVPFLRTWERENGFLVQGLATGGSVATAAWSLAKLLGADEVWFAGLDLGYPSGGTHAKGSQFEESFLRLGNRLAPAETKGFHFLNETQLVRRPSNDGKTVLSDVRMDLYRAWLEADLARHPEITVWNLSLSGSFVRGMKLAGALDLPKSSLSSPAEPSQGVLILANTVRRDLKPVVSSLEGLLRIWGQDRVQPPSEWENVAGLAALVWGEEPWELLMRSARRTWETFPGPRSLKRLRDAAELALEVLSGWDRVEETLV